MIYGESLRDSAAPPPVCTVQPSRHESYEVMVSGSDLKLSRMVRWR